MKTRAWFQIHLSTAIVLMFTAGGMLAIQFHRSTSETGFAQLVAGTLTIHEINFGWPAKCCSRNLTIIPRQIDSSIDHRPISEVLSERSTTIRIEEIDSAIPAHWTIERGALQWNLRGIVINLALALIALFLVSSLLERVLIRYRIWA